MKIEEAIVSNVIKAVESLYGATIGDTTIQIERTKRPFTGNFTIIIFPILKIAKKSAEKVGEEIGVFLQTQIPFVVDFNVIKGFLNIVIAHQYWLDELNTIHTHPAFGTTAPTEKSPCMMVEYSSPNTNKPLHLGHIRNNLLGFSIASIQQANGWKVVKTNIVNDRGIHICKSMLAWQLWGNGQTPENTRIKGDHLVGKYYVMFDQAYKAEVATLIEQGLDEEVAKKTAPLMLKAQQMLLAWENNDPEVRHLWATMNGWVYKGFDITYKKLGVDFDKIYYESETYIEGKLEVERGVANGIFQHRDDGSVWADLTDDGLQEKLLLRSDGTSVYITQDIGTAKLRYNDYHIDKMVYVVGNEQDHHFQVLSLSLHKLGFAWGKDLVHFSYGMVELPAGKMKSREGTVVDADDLIDEMITTAREISQQLGKLDDCTTEETEKILQMVGLGALKYFILKVDPRKNMTFNPSESIDFNGNTGPFIQYTHARIKSVLRKASQQGISHKTVSNSNIAISEKEVSLIQSLSEFPAVVQLAGSTCSPALIANYVYELVKDFNQFYNEFSILNENDFFVREFRLVLSETIASTIKRAMGLLGIDVPERM